MFRFLKPQISRNLSLQQLAGQFPIHTQLGSIKIDQDVDYGVDMYPHMQASLEGAHVCLRIECAFINVDLFFVYLWNPRASIGLV
jgi:hypothetical protein